MSFQAWPKFLAVPALWAPDSLPRRRRRRWVLWCGLALLTVGAWATQPPLAAPPVYTQFETPPIIDPFERARMQEIAKENTERHRVRITIPQAAFVQRPVDRLGHSAGNDAAASSDANPMAAFITTFALKSLCAVIGVWIWMAIARKVAPELLESMASWMPARAFAPAVSADKLVILLAEERAVSEFQAALSTRAPLRAAAAAVPDDVPQDPFEDIFAPAASLIRDIRRLLQDAGASTIQSVQRNSLLDAFERIRSLKSAAKPEGLRPLHHMASGLEMLLKQLTEKASNVTASTLRTAALAVETLEELCKPDINPELLSEPSLRLLVVDDETFSRYALSHALKRGLNEPDVAKNSEQALKLVARRTYDLILLDVQLPGMDGYELCSVIHETGPNRDTPVVFVTSVRDFEARANSIICGGRDLIAKPFLTFELTVKSLTLIAGERLAGRGRLSPEAVDELPADEQAMPVAEDSVVPVEEILESRPVAEPEPEAVPEPQPENTFDTAEAAQTAAGVPEATPAPKPPTLEEIKSKLPPGLPPMPANLPRRDRKHSPFVTGEATDANWQLELSEPDPGTAFVDQVRAQITVVRGIVQLIRDTPDEVARRGMMAELFVAMHLLAEVGEAKGQFSIALVASAFEALLKKLLENVSNLSLSTVDIMETAVDLMQDLCGANSPPDLATNPPVRALVVDDDPIALRAFSNAMQIRFSKPDTATGGKSGLELAAQKAYDVIFLDVYMPDLGGFEVCAQIRAESVNRPTPVVFLTASDSPELREKSALCGGTDFLTKPCLASELGLKALVLALRGRLENANTALAELAAYTT